MHDSNSTRKISVHIVGTVENFKNTRTKGFLILYANCCTNCHHGFNPYGILSALGLKQLTGRKVKLGRSSLEILKYLKPPENSKQYLEKKAGPLSWSNWNLEMFVFVKVGKLENPGKTWEQRGMVMKPGKHQRSKR